MNLEILETYVNIVKTRSFTKTAESMFISQSAVSSRLAKLEGELNVKLVERRPGQKGISLTRKGEEFAEFAKRYIDLERQILDWSSGSVTEVLRVSSVISLTHHVLKGFYLELLTDPRLSITLSPHWTDRIISMLENREADVGISPRVFYSRYVEATPIFDEPLYLISSKSVSSYPDQVDLREMKRSNEIYFDWGPRFVEWHDRLMNPLELPIMVTDTTEIIPDLLRLPNSFSIVPTSIFKHYHDNDLHLSRILPAPPCRTCYLLKPKDHQTQKEAVIQKFETELRQYVAGLPDIIPR